LRVRRIYRADKEREISQWSDYCDQHKSRRYGLAAWFTEWIELRTAAEEMCMDLARASHLAVLKERNRLAGEIHDGLAQYFSAICMQLPLIDRVYRLR
jgi:signal transduction histidine kinase